MLKTVLLAKSYSPKEIYPVTCKKAQVYCNVGLSTEVLIIVLRLSDLSLFPRTLPSCVHEIYLMFTIEVLCFMDHFSLYKNYIFCHESCNNPARKKNNNDL